MKMYEFLLLLGVFALLLFYHLRTNVGEMGALTLLGSQLKSKAEFCTVQPGKPSKRFLGWVVKKFWHFCQVI